MHGVFDRYHHEGRAHADDGEEIEEQRAQHVELLAHDNFVMAGLVLAIHDCEAIQCRKTWMPGTRPGMTVEWAGKILQLSLSPIWRVECQVLGDRALPAVAVRKQPLLVVIELLARLGGELE